jgi:hypothetical protein
VDVSYLQPASLSSSRPPLPCCAASPHQSSSCPISEKRIHVSYCQRIEATTAAIDPVADYENDVPDWPASSGLPHGPCHADFHEPFRLSAMYPERFEYAPAWPAFNCVA